MIVKCPACQTEYDLEPGTYQCECGVKFVVEIADATAETATTTDDDLNKTIAPKRYVDCDPVYDRTMPGKRNRKPDGYFEPGEVILNRYKVLGSLGRGGMGVVYKCFDETAGIEIALKTLPPELSHDEEEMEDIKANFQIVSKLVHQNICISKNLEKDSSNGVYYLIMECVDGEDLRRWIRQKRTGGPLTLDDVLPVIRQIAEALDYAHEAGIIHRDIKPGNVMIDQYGRIKILDFGLAAQIHSSMSRVSMAYHGTSGTATYMAPEQWRGQPQRAAADQYALAVMTYEMLAGRLPFEVSDTTLLREVVLNEQPQPIENLPKHVQNALLKALSKKPEDRFTRCTGFVDALEGQNAYGANRKRGKGMWVALAALIALAVIGVVYGYHQSAKARRIAEAQRIAVERQRKAEAQRIAEEQRQREIREEQAEKEAEMAAARKERERHNSLSTASISTDDPYHFNSLIFYAPLEQKMSRLSTGQAITTHGNVTYTKVDGIKCAHFDGKSYLTFPTDTFPKNECSISLWVKCTQLSRYETNIFSSGKDIYLQRFSGRLVVRSHAEKPDDEKKCSNSFNYQEWNHIVYTFSAEHSADTLNRIQVFLNGKKYASFAHVMNGPIYPIGYIGTCRFYPQNNILHGYMSAIRVYNRVLQESEITTLFHEFYRRSTSKAGSKNTNLPKTIQLPNGTKLEMVKIKAGSFMMGSPENELGRSNNEKLHRVTLTKDYWLGKFEVTQAQWKAVMGNNPSFFKNDLYPVEMVDWNNAKMFCNKMNKIFSGKLPEGYEFDLPTEAQWQYACRAGTTSALNNGKNLQTHHSRCPNLDEVAWHRGNSYNKLHIGGLKKANAWGLYDMHGNVWEWCRDSYVENYSNDPEFLRCNSAKDKVLVGGGFNSARKSCRSALRLQYSPTDTRNRIGFRLALVCKNP